MYVFRIGARLLAERQRRKISKEAKTL
jgi:hypothetical protein